MSAVVDFIEDVVGGVVEAVGDVVESVVDVVKDVGRAIDDYVIQPILDDPLTAIATMAGAAFLGPAIAPMLGTGLGAATGYVATGLGAAAGNTAAGLAQGEDFDDAVKGGLLAGVTAGATSAGFDYLTGAGAFGAEGAGTPSTAAAAAPDEALLTSAATPDEFLSSGASPVAEAFPVAPRPEIVATDLPPLTSIADDALTSGASGTSSAAASIVDDPLGEFIKNLPGMTDDAASAAASADPLGDFIAKLPNLADDVVAPPSVTGPEVPRDWLTEGVKFPKTDGIAAREIPLDTPLKYNLDGSVNYDLMAGIPQSSPIGFKPGGGAGLNVQVDALPDFKYSMDSLDPSIRGMGDVWTGESGKLYGTGTPEGIITETGFQPLPTQLATTGPSTTAGGTAGAGKTLGDKLKNFEFGDISLTDVGKAAMNYAVENPLTTLAAATLATGVLTGAGEPPAGGQPPGGRTKDENFGKPLDYYNYMRDLQAYGGDLTKYGERPGEHQFFVNTRFEPVPIPVTPPPGNKTGGLIQYKQHLARGGSAERDAIGNRVVSPFVIGGGFENPVVSSTPPVPTQADRDAFWVTPPGSGQTFVQTRVGGSIVPPEFEPETPVPPEIKRGILEEMANRFDPMTHERFSEQWKRLGITDPMESGHLQNIAQGIYNKQQLRERYFGETTPEKYPRPAPPGVIADETGFVPKFPEDIVKTPGPASLRVVGDDFDMLRRMREFRETTQEKVQAPRRSDLGGLETLYQQTRQEMSAGGIAGPQSGQMPQTPQNAMSQREAMMAAMQQRAAMAKRQGALAQMQGGMPGGMPMAAPGRAPQGMQGMMPQQQPTRQGPINRNPKTAYYQYGTPPAMAMGGALNMVRSMNIGGGADGRSDDVDALLSDGEYVIDAETVALLGNGSSEAGAKRLDKMRSGVRQHKGKNLSKGKISPNAKSPLAYMKGA